MLGNLVTLAGHLDSKGFHKESTFVDAIIKKLAMGEFDVDLWEDSFDGLVEEGTNAIYNEIMSKYGDALKKNDEEEDERIASELTEYKAEEGMTPEQIETMGQHSRLEEMIMNAIADVLTHREIVKDTIPQHELDHLYDAIASEEFDYMIMEGLFVEEYDRKLGEAFLGPMDED